MSLPLTGDRLAESQAEPLQPGYELLRSDDGIACNTQNEIPDYAVRHTGTQGLLGRAVWSTLLQFSPAKHFEHFCLGWELQEVPGILLRLGILRGTSVLSRLPQIVGRMPQLNVGSQSQ